MSRREEEGAVRLEGTRARVSTLVSRVVRSTSAHLSLTVDPRLADTVPRRTERFLLTAADQKDGSRSDRLARVIHAKFEAGLLRPYNHVAGYTRLMKWMADNMSASSRQRTLHTLSEFRPTFRVRFPFLFILFSSRS